MRNYEVKPDSSGNPDRVELWEGGYCRWNGPKDKYEAYVKHCTNLDVQRYTRTAERQAQGDPKLVIATDSRYGLSAYSIGSENDNPKGYGGDHWIIRFHNGRLVHSTSLWHEGPIPEEWHDRIKENATLAVKNPWHTKEYPL